MRQWAFVTAFVLAGCGSTFHEEKQTQQKSDSLSLERSVSRFEVSQKPLDASTKLVLENTDFQTTRRIERIISSTPIAASTPEQDLTALAIMAAEEIYPGFDLRFVRLDRGSRFAYATFQQFYQDFEVYGAKLILRLNGEGNWMTSNSTLVNPSLLTALPELKAGQISTSDYFSSAHRLLQERSVILPRLNDFGEMQMHFAREFVVFDLGSQEELWLWVDEISQQALAAYNSAEALDSWQVKGTIVPNSPDDTPTLAIFPNVTAIFDPTTKLISDAEGNFDKATLSEKPSKIVLENDFVSVFNNARSTREFDMDPTKVTESINIDSGPSIEDRNAFYWIMTARKFLSETLKYNGMTYKLGVYTNYGKNFDNAFFMPLTKTLSFGAGGKMLKNTALSRDVVLHEFGHAVTTAIYGTISNYEFNAMNEAFSDYFAATITNDPLIAEGVMQERTGMKFLRTVENEMVYPKDFSGSEFHKDGQMFGGALWNLRKAIGAQKADALIHEARLAQAKSIAEFLLELLVIDEKSDDRNPWTASKHNGAIWAAFRSHGLQSNVSWLQAPKEDLTIPWKRPQAGCFSVY